VIVAVSVEVMVVGPLGNPSSGVARDLGLDHVYAAAWTFLRWPVLMVIIVGFLSCLYRYSPNARQTWRDCLPGAVLGAVLWVLAAAFFRVSAALGLRSASGVKADDTVVTIIGQSVNAVVATVFWAYLASVAILLGGEFNAALRARRLAQSRTAQGGSPAADQPVVLWQIPHVSPPDGGASPQAQEGLRAATPKT
jgi:membrane protein